MEKAKNIVLVVCGVMLFFGSQAAYGTWLYIIVWAIGVAMLVFGIVGLHKNRSNRKAEASKRDPAENGFYDPNCHVSNNYEQPPEAHRSRKTVKIIIIGFAAFSLIIGIITTANYDPSKANRMTDEERQEMLDLIPPAPIPIGTQAFFLPLTRKKYRHSPELRAYMPRGTMAQIALCTAVTKYIFMQLTRL